MMFVLVMLIALTIALALVVWLMARQMLHPPRMTDGKAIYLLKRISPGDLGMAFEEVDFFVRDARSDSKIKIKAWWIPATGKSDRTVIMVHGTADAKVGSIAWAEVFRKVGMNLLAIDLPAAGESEGDLFTGGWFEREDVAQVMDESRARWPDQTRRLVLFGISSGALAALGASELREVDALVLESPVESFGSGLKVQAGLLRMPTGWILRWAIRLAEWMSGAKLMTLKASEMIGRSKVPILTIAGTEDVFLNEQERGAMRAAHTGNKSIWWIDGAGHLLGYSKVPNEYEERVARFLNG